MIGRLDPSTRRATIIGGGIAGLIAAYRLVRAGFEIELHEAGPRLGGLIQTVQTPYGLSEAALHSTLVSEPVREFFDELNVPLVAVRDDSRARFVWRSGKLRRLPLSVAELSQAFARAYFVLADSQADPTDLTLETWARRHLGPAALDYLLNPFVRGIYAARPSELSVAAAFPALVPARGHSLLSQLLRRARTRKGPRPPKKRMMTARDGMESLVRALEGFLRASGQAAIHLNSPVLQYPNTKNIVISLPAGQAAQIASASGDSTTAELLGRVRYAPLVSITAFVKRSHEHPKGVGVLCPERESARQCLGILFNSSSFEGRVQDAAQAASYTVMIGGTSQAELAASDDRTLTQIVQTELSTMLGVKDDLLHTQIHRWPMAIPVYSRELYQVWSTMSHRLQTPGRVYFSNWTGQVSLRGMIESSLALPCV